MVKRKAPRKYRTLDAVIGVVLLFMAVAAFIFVLMSIFQSKDKAPVVDATKKSVSNHTPALKSSVVIGGLDHPWDIAFLPDNSMLMTERAGSISKVIAGQKIILHYPDDVYARGEGGMLGLAVDPKFANNHYIYTCFNSSLGGPDVRVVRWKVDDNATSLSGRKDIVTGIPSNASGRHSGCRLGFGAAGTLWIGTGDAALGGVAQDLKGLGGKILRVDREGNPVKGNLGGDADPRIFSYGHRNIQGLAFYRTIKNGLYGVSIEHGSHRDDEVNRLSKGNFGWAPSISYIEREPMTDLVRFPDAVSSVWSSGEPTIAPADADFLIGEKWGKWEGRLAMAVLKDKHLRLLELKDNGKTGEQLKVFNSMFGRLRAVTMHTDGSLYLTTDNGNNQDFVLRITPDL